jgi:hypothetical protein
LISLSLLHQRGLGLSCSNLAVRAMFVCSLLIQDQRCHCVDLLGGEAQLSLNSK